MISSNCEIKSMQCYVQCLCMYVCCMLLHVRALFAGRYGAHQRTHIMCMCTLMSRVLFSLGVSGLERVE